MDWMYKHKTFTGSMDWMYEHKNIYKHYGLDVRTQKHLQTLWTGCMNTKTFTGSMDWMYQSENI